MALRSPPPGDGLPQPRLPAATPPTPLLPTTALPTLPAVPAPPPAGGIDVRPLDAAGGLRILVEEVRSAVLEYLLAAPGAARAAAPAALPIATADPGNTAAALLRWLQTAVPPAGGPATGSLEQALATGFARAATQLSQLSASVAVMSAVSEAQALLQRGLPPLTAPPFRPDLPVERPPAGRRRRRPAGPPGRVEPIPGSEYGAEAAEGADEFLPARRDNDAEE